MKTKNRHFNPLLVCKKVVLFLFIATTLTVSMRNLDRAEAAIISNSGEEVEYHYSATFRSLTKAPELLLNSRAVLNESATRKLAYFHAQHLFGLFHSTDYVEQFDLPTELVEGFAGTRHPKIVKARAFLKADDPKNPLSTDPYIWVEYEARGKMLVLKPILKSWIGQNQTGQVSLPLLVDLPKIYKDDLSDYSDKTWRNCTDSHYWGPGDFSYFYAPFRCKELSEAPIARKTSISLKRVTEETQTDIAVPLKTVRGDNQNGKLAVLYFTYGFDDTPDSGSTRKEIQKDVGTKLYRALHVDLTSYGFKKIESAEEFRKTLGEDAAKIKLQTYVKREDDRQRVYFSTHIKHEGSITWVVRSALFDTRNVVRSEPLVSFPKFWKEAWENADFLYYGGHSGDGASLSLQNTLDTLAVSALTDIQFNQKKTQIAFFDACSSYAHYLDMYKKIKRRNLHLLSYGLVSLFHLGRVTTQTALDVLMNSEASTTWMTALNRFEENQLRPHIEYLHGTRTEEQKRDTEKLIQKYKSRNLKPSFLLNVSVD